MRRMRMRLKLKIKQMVVAAKVGWQSMLLSSTTTSDPHPLAIGAINTLLVLSNMLLRWMLLLLLLLFGCVVTRLQLLLAMFGMQKGNFCYLHDNHWPGSSVCHNCSFVLRLIVFCCLPAYPLLPTVKPSSTTTTTLTREMMMRTAARNGDRWRGFRWYGGSAVVDIDVDDYCSSIFALWKEASTGANREEAASPLLVCRFCRWTVFFSVVFAASCQ